jgi:hypothetical protein
MRQEVGNKIKQNFSYFLFPTSYFNLYTYDKNVIEKGRRFAPAFLF